MHVCFDFNFVFAGSPELFSGRGMFVGHICNWYHHWLQVFKPARPTFQEISKSEKLRKFSIFAACEFVSSLILFSQVRASYFRVGECLLGTFATKVTVGCKFLSPRAQHFQIFQNRKICENFAISRVYEFVSVLIWFSQVRAS